MIFFYIRHGDPIYNPDSLTPLGERQAEAVAKRLALHGLDRIFSSTSERARLTAKPTCELLRLKPTELEFCKECHTSRQMMIRRADGSRRWLFEDDESIRLMATPEVRAMGEKWHEHPFFAPFHYEEGLSRIARESDAFFLSLGYERDRANGGFRVITPNAERVALFAHQGFGMHFLSDLLGIPLPYFATSFDLSHSCMTVIEFREVDGYTVPRILTLANDSHLYREGLPTLYNYRVTF